MAEENLGAAPEERTSGSWRGRWASIGAILATILLLALIVMVTVSNRARDEALGWERHAYDVMHMTRVVDSTVARSEVTLGRFVLSEQEQAGREYYDEWRLAGRQIDRLKVLTRSDPPQRRRVDELERLYQARGRELAAAAASAAARLGSGGVPLFFQAGQSRTGPEMRAKLDEIAASERERLRGRMQQTQMFGKRAGMFTELLGWLGVLLGAGAVLLGYIAYQAISERVAARREAQSEANRAQALEQAVLDRTRELSQANELLRAEAAERAAAEAQLRQVQKMEAVGRLTGGIAHDFNNMLAVVVGGLDMAKRKLGRSPGDVEMHLDNAMEGATRAAALTRRLLAFARSEPLVPEAVAPADLIGGMLELIDRSIGELITVKTRFPDEPWHVFVDVNQLENAVVNLAVNARDAMGGEGEIGIAIDNVRLNAGEVGALPSGDYVRVSVEDRGVGIAPEHLERVFEPFFTTKPVGKGTGLGLSQIFSFARESGGDVEIQSTWGTGTTVSIYLPRSIAAAEALAQRSARSDAEPREARTGAAGAVVLVVEDDPRVSRSTVGALEELGYRPLAAASGREALEILQREPPVDLVITDVMMPEMNGPELVHAIAERHPGPAILFVTGYVGEGSEAEDLSGYEMLRKPFTIGALAAAVTRALDRRVSGSRPASTSAAAE
jgi:signal transduction histidine kinase/ActR/RegA family two-component response regulator